MVSCSSCSHVRFANKYSNGDGFPPDDWDRINQIHKTKRLSIVITRPTDSNLKAFQQWRCGKPCSLHQLINRGGFTARDKVIHAHMLPAPQEFSEVGNRLQAIALSILDHWFTSNQPWILKSYHWSYLTSKLLKGSMSPLPIRCLSDVLLSAPWLQDTKPCLCRRSLAAELGGMDACRYMYVYLNIEKGRYT